MYIISCLSSFGLATMKINRKVKSCVGEKKKEKKRKEKKREREGEKTTQKELG